MTIHWLSKKNNCIAKSIRETKCIAYNSIMTNVVWMKHFIESLSLSTSTELINVFCNN